MSDKMRWRYGDTNPVVAAVDSSTAIEIGDLVYQDVDDAKPASHISMANSKLEVAQTDFARKFLGVALQRCRYGDTDPIRVATTGVFEFDCPSGTFELGDLVGAEREMVSDGTPSGEKDEFLANQTVTQVPQSEQAIGRVAKRVPTAATSVLVDVRSTVMTGGVKGD